MPTRFVSLFLCMLALLALAAALPARAQDPAQPAEPAPAEPAPEQPAPAEPAPAEPAPEQPAPAEPAPAEPAPEQPAPAEPAPAEPAPEQPAPAPAQPGGGSEAGLPAPATPPEVAPAPAPVVQPTPAADTTGFQARYTRAAVAPARAHGLFALVFTPGFTDPVASAGTFSARGTLDIAGVKVPGIDATYGAGMFDLRYALSDDLDVGVAFGLGGWDGTLTVPGLSGQQKASINLLDVLLSARYQLALGGLDLVGGLTVKLPAGSADDAIGTEHLDVGLDLTAVYGMGELAVLGHVGGALIGPSTTFGIVSTEALTFGLGVSYLFGDFGASVTFNALTTTDTRPVFDVGLGMRYALVDVFEFPLYPEIGVSFGVSDTAADFVVRLGLLALF